MQFYSTLVQYRPRQLWQVELEVQHLCLPRQLYLRNVNYNVIEILEFIMFHWTFSSWF